MKKKSEWKESQIIKKKHFIEVLSPAGSFQAVKAVIAAGADAVYAAGRQFGARAYADNLTNDELCHAIDFAHIHRKRFYLTVNTLFKESELKIKLYDYLLPLYIQGLDAVIVQDFGVLSFIKREFPDLTIHASTQMNITTKYGAMFLQEQGCSRVVTARELSLEEIRDIRLHTDLEIESFVHGALCYSYSGQCLFSSLLGGRSGNRGRCAQPCRLPYSFRGSKPSFFMSLKDLQTIEILPQLFDSGVCSLKIEGRMKKAAYGAGVTSIYRKYVDLYQEAGAASYKVSKKDLQMLFDLGNRSGFTKGYYLNLPSTEKNSMVTKSKPSHTKSNQELQIEIQDRYSHGRDIGAESTLPFWKIQEKIKGSLIISKHLPVKLTVACFDKKVEVVGPPAERADKQPIELQTVAMKIKKTGNTPFIFEELQIEMEPDIFYSMSVLNKLRRDALIELERLILKDKKRNHSKQHAEPYLTEKKQTVHKHHSAKKHLVLSVSVATKEQFDVILSIAFIDHIYIDCNAFLREAMIDDLFVMNQKAEIHRKKLFLCLPFVFRYKNMIWYEENISQLLDTGLAGFVVKNFDELMLLKKYIHGREFKIILDSSVYSFNNEAVEAFREEGVDQLTIPIELNKKELSGYDCSNSELLVYGYLPLMISAQCIKENHAVCERGKEYLPVKDRYGKHFFVQSICEDCYNVIYNSTPLSLIQHGEDLRQMQITNHRISFTMESKEELLKILRFYHEEMHTKVKPEIFLRDYTNGHFKRGVE